MPDYVQYPFILTWNFFTKNIVTSILFILLLFLLVLGNSLPIIQYISPILISLIMLSLHVYISRTLSFSDSIDEFNAITEKTSIIDIITSNISVSIGIFIGLFTLYFILGITVYFAYEYFSSVPKEQYSMGYFVALSSVFVLYMLIVLALVYILPLILAIGYEKEDLLSAAMSLTLLFSLEIWKAGYKERYYVLVSVLHTVFIGAALLVWISLSNMLLIPFLPFILYLSFVYLGIVSISAKNEVLA